MTPHSAGLEAAGSAETDEEANELRELLADVRAKADEVRPHWPESLDWTGLGWTGLDWIAGLDWIGLDGIGLDVRPPARMSATGLDWMVWIGMNVCAYRPSECRQPPLAGTTLTSTAPPPLTMAQHKQANDAPARSGKQPMAAAGAGVTTIGFVKQPPLRPIPLP